MTIRILIADDIDLVAEAFEALLSTEPTFEIVARVRDGNQVVEAVRAYRPDVAVVDVDMPILNGIQATAELRRNGLDCRVLLLTALPGSGHLHRALTAGASGYLLKSTTGARLIEAIKTVCDGRTVVDPELAAEALRAGPSPLTERERGVLQLLDQGLGTEEVARTLFLSRGTVRNYLSSAMTKLEAKGRVEALRVARERGWL